LHKRDAALVYSWTQHFFRRFFRGKGGGGANKRVARGCPHTGAHARRHAPLKASDTSSLRPSTLESVKAVKASYTSSGGGGEVVTALKTLPRAINIKGDNDD
jgi:hypothetical protein